MAIDEFGLLQQREPEVVQPMFVVFPGQSSSQFSQPFHPHLPGTKTTLGLFACIAMLLRMTAPSRNNIIQSVVQVVHRSDQLKLPFLILVVY